MQPTRVNYIISNFLSSFPGLDPAAAVATLKSLIDYVCILLVTEFMGQEEIQETADHAIIKHERRIFE